jgi:hypothetical protein
MTIATEPYTNGAAKARETTEKTVDIWKQGVEQFTQQTSIVGRLPQIDLSESVAQYFDYVQVTVDINRELAARWAEIVSSLLDSVREQAQKVNTVVTDQVDSVADLVTSQAQKVEEIADEQAALAEEAAKEQEREARRLERAAARQAKQHAREPYENLTKAELSEQLAERGLPKTGNVDELIERLATADSQ